MMRYTGSARSFWGLLDAPERQILATAARPSSFVPGATICMQGDPATHVFVLVSGWVKVVSVTSEGQEMLVALRGNGDVVGELAGEVTGYRTATIYAIDRVRSLVVPHERFSDFLDTHPAAGRAYRHTLSQRWSQTAESLEVRSSTTGAQRLARQLLELAERHGRGGEGTRPGETVIALPLSQQELASLVSTSRATVTRALSDWRRRRLIRTGQRRVTIIDTAALRRIAGLRP
jgi:CRP/FNR family transcriptional regulator, cyclic AMP receptor protein